MNSLMNVEEVVLLDGKKVKVRMGSAVRSKQIFIQLSENLLAGILNEDGYSGMYVWKKENEVFEYLGDLSLHEESEGRVSWNIFANDVTKEGGSIAYCQHKCFYAMSPTHVRIFSALRRRK